MNKNNIARNKNYQKNRNKKVCELFEYHVINYHAEKYENHTVWHWNKIPESELLKAGYIHSFNEHRMKRISSYKNDPTHNPFRDIGFDGIIRDEDGVYHAIQAKYYTNNISAVDLGTFIVKLLLLECRNNNSCGYLYHNSDLTLSLREDLCLLEKSNKLKIINEYIDDFSPDKRGLRTIHETKYKLYKHQKKYIDIISKLKSKTLYTAACGTGKTLMCGYILNNILRNRKFDVIVLIAPLIVSTDNLYDRVPKFFDIQSYKTLLVDSEGTTSFDDIKNFLENKGTKIIFSTFRSAKEVLNKTLPRDVRQYILVDECHNITKNQPKLSKFVNSFKEGLFLTATPPKCIEKILDINETFSYTLKDALKDKIVCDYQIWFPLMKLDNNDEYCINCNIPSIFESLPVDITQKCLFLANGIFQTASRRTIVYCSSIEECIEFQEIFTTILREYHGLDCIINLINMTTTKEEREKILDKFESNDEEIHLLVSVRVLDEAIDLKKCDSEFITNCGEHTSDIRTVQRFMRGCRIDPDNSTKINNLFVWSNIYDDKSLRIFDLLRQSDPRFSQKVKTLSLDYDSQNDKEILVEQEEQTKLYSEYFNIDCISLDAFRFYKGKLIKEWVEKEGVIPPFDTVYKGIKIGNMLAGIVSARHENEDVYNEVLKDNDIIREYYEKRQIKLIENTTTKKYTPYEKADIALEWIEDKGVFPPRKEIYKGVKIGDFLKGVCEGRNKKVYDEKLCYNEIVEKEYCRRQKIREENALEDKISPDEKGDILLEWVEEHGIVPPVKQKHKGVNIGQFWVRTSGADQHNNDIYINKLQYNSILKEDFETKEEKRKEKITFTTREMTILLKEYVELYGIAPPAKMTDYKGAPIGNFWDGISGKRHHNKKLYKDDLQYNSILKEDYEKKESKRKEKEENGMYLETKEKAILLLEWVEKNGIIPPGNLEYKGYNIGSFWRNIRYFSYGKRIYDLYLSENYILRNDYEKHNSQ